MADPLFTGTVPRNDREEVRVTLDRYQGKPVIDVRTWADYTAGAVAGRGPTKKGVSLPAAQIPALIAALQAAQLEARSLGFLEHHR